MRLAHSTLKTERAAVAAREGMRTLANKTDQVCFVCYGDAADAHSKVRGCGPLCRSCGLTYEARTDEIAAAIKEIVRR